MRKIILFLFCGISFFKIYSQDIDHYKIWSYDFQDTLTKKYGLLKLYYGESDTLEKAKFDEVKYLPNSIILVRENQKWFKVILSGNITQIPYSQYLTEGYFSVPNNGKVDVYSTIEDKIILSGVDSVKIIGYYDETRNILNIFKNNILYYLDYKGQLVYSHGEAEIEVGYNRYIFENSIAKNKKDLSPLIGLTIKSLDNKETELLPIEFDYFYFKENNELCFAKKGSEYYLYNGLFKLITISETEPENANQFYKIKNKGKYGLIDINGKTILPSIYDSIESNYYWQITVKKDNKYGYFTNNGKEIFPCTFEKNNIKIISEKENIYNIESIGNDGYTSTPLFYYNDALDKKIFYSKYISLISFKHLGKQELVIAKKGNQYGIIDWDENIIVPFAYDTIGEYVIPDGFNMFNGLYPFKKNGIYGFLNSEFKTFIEPKFENIDFSYLEIGMPVSYVPIKNNKKWGILNLITKEINNCLYDTIISTKQYNDNNSYYDLLGVLNTDTFQINNKGQRLYNAYELGFKEINKKFYLYYSIDDSSEKQVLPTIFTDYAEMDGDFYFKVGKINKKYQVYDLALNMLGNYDYVENYINDIPLVKVSNNKKIGYLNMNGIEVIPCVYDKILSEESGEFYCNSDLHLVLCQRNGKWGLLNTQTYKEILPCIYDYIDSYQFEFDYNVKAVKRNNKWGLVSLTTFNEIISCKLDKFSMNYDIYMSTIAQLLDGEIKGKKGLYSCEGKEILACEYDKLDFFNYEYIIFEKNGKKGAVNNSLQIILPALYDEILISDNEISQPMPFVKQNGKYALFNYFGKQISQYKYDNVSFSKYNFIVSFNNKYTLLDTTGNELFPAIYDDLGGYYTNNFFAKKGGKYGFIDINDKIIIPFVYETVKEALDSFFIVKNNGKWGVVNLLNETVVSFDYDDITPNFISGSKVSFNIKKEKWGLADNTGKILVPLNYSETPSYCIHDNRFVVHSKDKEGIFDIDKGEIISPAYTSINKITIDENNIIYEVHKNKKVGLLSLDGKILYPIELDKISNFKEGLFVILKGKKYGFMDTSYKIVIPCQYDVASYFENGKASVTINKGKKDEQIFFIDKTGKKIE